MSPQPGEGLSSFKVIAPQSPNKMWAIKTEEEGANSCVISLLEFRASPPPSSHGKLPAKEAEVFEEWICGFYSSICPLFFGPNIQGVKMAFSV